MSVPVDDCRRRWFGAGGWLVHAAGWRRVVRIYFAFSAGGVEALYPRSINLCDERLPASWVSKSRPERLEQGLFRSAQSSSGRAAACPAVAAPHCSCIKVLVHASIRVGGTSARHPGSLFREGSAWLDPATRGRRKGHV